MAALELAALTASVGATPAQGASVATPAAEGGEIAASSPCFGQFLQANESEKSALEVTAKPMVARVATQVEAQPDAISAESGMVDAAAASQDSALAGAALVDEAGSASTDNILESPLDEGDSQENSPPLTAETAWMGLALCLQSRAVLQGGVTNAADIPSSQDPTATPTGLMPYTASDLNRLGTANLGEIAASPPPIAGTWANPQSEAAGVLAATTPLIDASAVSTAGAASTSPVATYIASAQQAAGFALSELDWISPPPTLDASAIDPALMASAQQPITASAKGSVLDTPAALSTASIGVGGLTDTIQIGVKSAATTLPNAHILPPVGDEAAGATGLRGKDELLLRPVVSLAAADKTIAIEVTGAGLHLPAAGGAGLIPPTHLELAGLKSNVVQNLSERGAATHLTATPTQQNPVLAGTQLKPTLEAAGVAMSTKASGANDLAIASSLITANSITTAESSVRVAHLPRLWNRQLTNVLLQDSSALAAESALPAANNINLGQGAASYVARDGRESLPLTGSEPSEPVMSYNTTIQTDDAHITLAVGDVLPQASVAEIAPALALHQSAAPAVTSAVSPSLSAVTPAPSRFDATPPTTLPLTPETLNFNQKHWDRVLGQQLNWMVNNQVQEAEIRVDPPNLGPLELRLSLHHNQTNVTFFSHEAAVREALEQALPRLRELLDGQGIQLGQAQVSDQSLARQQAEAGGQPGYGQRGDRWSSTPHSETEIEEEQPLRRSHRLSGRVDHYA